MTRAAVLVLAAAYVRAQLAVHRGFDLALAAITLVGGEVLIEIVADSAETTRWMLAILVAGGIGAACGMAWSFTLARRYAENPFPSAGIFVASLGLATLTSGLVAMLRGPGLRQAAPVASLAWMSLAPTAVVALCICALGGVALAAWRLSRTGLQVELLDQDRAFAEELGVDPAAVAATTGLACGTAAALAGAANAAMSGSTPTTGLGLFLQAAAAALIFSRAGLAGVIGGAVVIATAQVLVTTSISPSWADAILFALLLALLVLRKPDRAAESVR